MPNEFPDPGALAALEEQIALTGRAFRDQLAVPAIETAALIRDSMREAGEALENTLVRATRTGRLSFADMARSIAADLARVAFNRFVTQPLQGLLTGVLTSAFGGARAEGGPVAPGQAFLVGERGPELFVPGASGQIAPRAQGRMQNVSIEIKTPDAESFRRSESQTAAAIARMMARANRNR